MSFDYKKYSLEQLENWIHDAMSDESTTSREIYDVIYNVADENYSYFQKNAEKAKDLMKLMKGERIQTHYEKMISNGYEMTADGFWFKEVKPKVKSWVLPVEETKNVDTDETEYFITLPQDFLELNGWVEGDQIEWIDRKDGTYQIRKVTNKQQLLLEE